MDTISAKTILTSKKDPSWFGTEYNMNLYKGCCHGCIYCDSRSDCYQISDFDTVRAKENALTILATELHSKIKTGVIGTGSMSDPYNPYEAVHHLTGRALELVDQYGFGIAIATKSNLITRDIVTLKKIKAHSPVLCKITITCAEDELSSKIEPQVCVSSERFQAVKALSDAGIFTGILMMPLLPYLTDTEENVVQLIHRAKECGARFIYPLFGLSLRAGQREYLYDKLTELFPDKKLKDAYIRLYGANYVCRSPREKELHQIFASECSRLGILYRMDDIIHAYRLDYEYRQFSLF